MSFLPQAVLWLHLWEEHICSSFLYIHLHDASWSLMKLVSIDHYWTYYSMHYNGNLYQLHYKVLSTEQDSGYSENFLAIITYHHIKLMATHSIFSHSHILQEKTTVLRRRAVFLQKYFVGSRQCQNTFAWSLSLTPSTITSYSPRELMILLQNRVLRLLQQQLSVFLAKHIAVV